MPEDSAKSSWWRAPGLLATAAAVPVVLVNGTAFIGQFAFLHAHVPWILPGQVLVAVAIELTAVYLAWHAHLATMANDSSGRLKAGAYSFAQIVGAMNYSHYAAPHWRPTVMAVLMYCMSALSPWLWGIHTRRASRDKLMERNLVEEHSVRLGATRWMWHVIRSARVTYWATWHGVNEPARAIGRFADRYGTADEPAPARATRLRSRRAEAPAITAPAPVPVIVPAQLPPAAPRREARPPRTAPDGAPARRNPQARRAAPAPEVTAEAALQAEPTLGAPEAGPSAEVISSVELRLAGMPDHELPSRREVARMLSETSDQRRLAKRLLDQRMAAGLQPHGSPQQEEAPGNGARNQGVPQGMISPPRGFQPGGNGVNG